MRTKSHVRRDTFLCGVDFSAHSRRALRDAVAAAKRLDGTLTVLFVEDPRLIAAAVVAYGDDALAKEAASQLRRFVRRAIGQVPGVPTECVVAVGKPAPEIEKAAARLGATAIVLGTQGLRGVRRIFLGSTTQHVLRTTSVPVLAIPPRAPAKPSARWPGDRVAVAVDVDDYTMVDARAAARLAGRFNAKVVLVYVLRAIQGPPWLKLRGGRDATRIEEAAAKLARVAEALGPAVDVETRVLIGNPAEAIAAFTKKERVDLAILTLRRGKGILGSRPGSMTYQLLTLGSTPVLSIPGRPSEE
jgi:nucleotide-binding universal stress UspA family protein